MRYFRFDVLLPKRSRHPMMASSRDELVAISRFPLIFQRQQKRTVHFTLGKHLEYLEFQAYVRLKMRILYAMQQLIGFL